MLTTSQALKTGPAEIVYAGRNGYAAPGKEDYGVGSIPLWLKKYH